MNRDRRSCEVRETRYQGAVWGALSFLAGAFLLCCLSTLQKIQIGAPLGWIGYLIPTLFGGASGLMISMLIAKLTRRMKTSQHELELRVRAEEALAEKTMLLDNILRSASDVAIATTDLDLRITYYNPMAEKLFGYTATEVVGKTVMEMHTKERVAPERFEQAAEIVRREGQYHYLLTPETKDGTRYLDSRIEGIFNHNGELVGFSLFSRDITDWEQAKQSGEEWKNRYQAAVDASGQILYDWDSVTDEVVYGGSLEAVLGYTQEDMAGGLQRWRALIHPDDLPDFDALIERVVKTGETAHGTYRVRKKNGEYAHLENTGEFFLDAQGTLVRMVGFLKDITERKHAEEALLRERRLFIGGPVVVFRWIAAEGWPVEFVSPNVVDLFGYTPEDLTTGRVPYINVVHRDDRQRVADEVAAHCREGASTFEQDYRIVRADGTVRWLYDFTVIHRDETGRITHYEGYVLDATERKQAEEEKLALERQVQQAQKMESLGVLAGGIAHDFNNLLVGILGNADLALDTLDTGAPARNHVSGIIKAAKRAADLARQMLAYSGKGRFVVEALDLNKLVDEMANLVEVAIPKKVVLKYEFGEELPAIEADGTQIRQVVMNLITNASEAIGSKSGVVSIRTGAANCDREYLKGVCPDDNLKPGLYTFVEVTDTGCGMDEKTIARIFEPFYTTKFTGRGLGLAAVLGIMRGHKGALKIYSEPGKGTAFKALFPALAGPAAVKSEELGETLDWRPGGMILLVDDDQTVLSIGKQFLERANFDVLTVSDGLAALDVFQRHADEIVAVILDLTMPRMDGDDCFRELRRIRHDARVILTSGYNEQELTQRFAGRGFAGFIQKPYRQAELISKLREVIALQQPADTSS